MTLDSSQGTTAETRYKAYGEDYTSSGTQPTAFRFTGQRLDAGIQLYFYNARYYDHIVGRFLQADTIVPQAGNPQSLNRYSYVGNNPLRYTDPSGFCATEESEDPECWAVYYQVSKRWGSSIPDDLWQWSIMQLIRLRIWLNAGIRFGGEPWTSDQVGTMMQGLDRVRNAVGSDTLGFIYGSSLTGLFQMTNMTAQVQAGMKGKDRNVGAWGDRNGIEWNFGAPGDLDYFINTAIHESGHALDTALGGWMFGGNTYWSATSVEWLAAGGWIHKLGDRKLWEPRNQGVTTAYARQNPWEDFAETFTWRVQKDNGILWGNKPGDSRQAALTIALGYVR